MPVNHVTSVQHVTDSDVVTLGSDSEEELPLTGVKSSSDSDDSDDEEGEISSEGDASARPGPGSETVQAETGTDRKKRKRKKKKKGKKKASNEREVCKYFMTRNCSKGQDCPYLHPVGLKLDEVCRFYRSGVCRRGDECIYSHDLSREACKHMVQGACLYGERCRFSHDPVVVDAQRRITPQSHKARVKHNELATMTPVNMTPVTQTPPQSAPQPTTPLVQAANTASTLPTLSFVAQQRDPRLDPALIMHSALVSPGPVPSVANSTSIHSIRAASTEPPSLSTSFDLSLLTPTQPVPKSNVADELKKLL